MIAFQKQPIMLKVVYSLIPLMVFSVLMYGWRAVVILALSFIFAILTEYCVQKWISKKKDIKVSQAILVTASLYGLSLHPRLADIQNWWVVVLGIIFAVFIARELFGGFGRNIFNPAISGRLFIFLTFPALLTGGWLVPVFVETLNASGLFSAWASGLNGVSIDANIGPTPLVLFKTGNDYPLWKLFFGLRGGSLGESPIFLIILSAGYLMLTKTANYRLILSTLLGSYLTMAFFYYLGPAMGITPTLEPLKGLFSGSIFFVAVYMATDPVSAPRKNPAQWVYGLLIGLVTVLIRLFGGFPEGATFGLIMGNVFASLLDELWTKKETVKKEVRV